MGLRELTDADQPDLVRGRPCVVIAAARSDEDLRLCLESTLTHTSPEIAIVIASALPVSKLRDSLELHLNTARAIWLAHTPAEPPEHNVDALTVATDNALSLLWPADIALIGEPSRVTAGWLDRLQSAARADTNTATASALAKSGTSLALSDLERSPDLAELAKRVACHTLALRPRLSLAVGPCVYIRRDALELVGPLDGRLDLRWALEVDLAQRCVLAGLAHVAADDVLVERLGRAGARDGDLPATLGERYPYLSQPLIAAASPVLPRSLEAARRPRSRMSVTIDARALSTTLTGTQRHILGLVKALAATDALRLRLVVGADTSAASLELLRSLPQTELLPIESIDDATPRSTVFHRPQQVFGTADLRLALRLGERIVLNQLDLIAYRNPRYHTDATAWHSYRRVSRQALAAADRILVFSNHTHSELLSDELVEEDRLRIIPPGLDPPSSAEGRQPASLAEPHQSPANDEGTASGYLLCLGTDFRHKNRVFALRLLAALRERHAWKGRLVLAGTHVPNGSSIELERAFLSQHSRLARSVVQLGAVDEAERTWLMSHAAAVVYPSVYEGFGLVPFEAALSSVPCVFAPQSSLAEVLPAKTAAIVPWNPEESADRTHALLIDPAARARHIETVLALAGRLTWSAAAADTLETYAEAAVAPVREAVMLSRDEVEREHTLRELVAAQDALVARLVSEREHAQRMYDELNAEVGFALGLIGPHGALPEDVQRALLALSARPALSGPAYAAASRAFRAARAIGRAGKSRSR